MFVMNMEFQKPRLFIKILRSLAAAYAEAGRFTEAVATAEKACLLASERKETALLERNKQLLELYRAGRPAYTGKKLFE